MRSLLDMLPRMSDHDLMYLAHRHAVPGQALSRKQMLAALTDRFGDPEYLCRTVKALPRPVQLTLRAHALADEWWTVQAALRQWQEGSYDQHVAELRHFGFIAEGGTLVPAEVAQAAIQLWIEELAEKAESPPEKRLVPDPTGPGALRDLFALMAMGWRRELPLTKERHLFRKAMDDLLERVEGSPLVRSDQLKLVVYGYAIHRGLLAQALYDNKGKTGLITTKRAYDWAELSWGEIWADVADHFLQTQAQHLPMLRQMLKALARLSPETWLPQAAWASDFGRLTGQEPSTLETLLYMLAGLDLLEIGISGKNRYVLRPSAALRSLLSGLAPTLPPVEDQFVLAPTYEVVAPKTVSPRVLLSLERWCGNRSADKVLTYTLSPGSLHVAREEGDDPKAILAFFEQHARAPLAQNVLFSLREWTAPALKARFEQVTLLRLSGAVAAERARSDKVIRGLILEQVTPTDLIVAPGAVERIRKRLGDLGVTPTPGVERPGVGAPAQEIVWQNPDPEGPVSAKEFAQRWFGSMSRDRDVTS